MTRATALAGLWSWALRAWLRPRLSHPTSRM